MRKLLPLLILIQIPAYAKLDASQQDALTKTQDLMRNPEERQKAIKKDPRAQDADAKAGALAGSDENKNEMYDIASDVMEKIATEAKGDPDKMQMLLLEAQKNPQAFYQKYFSHKDQKRVHQLATKIQNDQPGVGNER